MYISHLGKYYLFQLKNSLSIRSDSGEHLCSLIKEPRLPIPMILKTPNPIGLVF